MNAESLLDERGLESIDSKSNKYILLFIGSYFASLFLLHLFIFNIYINFINVFNNNVNLIQQIGSAFYNCIIYGIIAYVINIIATIGLSIYFYKKIIIQYSTNKNDNTVVVVLMIAYVIFIISPYFYELFFDIFIS